MNTLTDLLRDVPPLAAYALVAVVVLAESVLLIGAFVPTLTLLLTAGALSRAGTLHLAAVVAVAATTVVCGDALGHRMGRVLGARLDTGRLGRRLPTAVWRTVRALLARRGGQTVLICRFLPLARTVAPYLVGASGLRYRRMAPYSALAAVMWATGEAGAGYLAADWLERVITMGTTGVIVVVVAVALVVLVSARARRGFDALLLQRLAQPAGPAGPAQESAEADAGEEVRPSRPAPTDAAAPSHPPAAAPAATSDRSRGRRSGRRREPPASPRAPDPDSGPGSPT